MRIRLDVCYDGTGFSGWAVQPLRRTVAGVLSEALTTLFGEVAGLTVAGRTDAGVHASGQVCHVEVPESRWTALSGTLVRRLAGILPADVRVLAAAPAPPGFDARFSATSRRYTYRVTDAPYGAEPLRRHDTLAWPRPLDLGALRSAVVPLVGEHDFAAFCKRKDHATTVRAIAAFDWHRDGDGVLVATIEADAFCQAMVRSLIGALLAVGDGRQPVGWPAAMLSRRTRASEVVVAPPHGLNLVAVTYPSTVDALVSRAEVTRRLRA